MLQYLCFLCIIPLHFLREGPVSDSDGIIFSFYLFSENSFGFFSFILGLVDCCEK